MGIHQSQLRVQGRPATYTNAGDSGGSVTRHFCGRCGGRLYTSGTLPGEVVMVQVGSLDEPGAVTPEAVIYLKDALPWDHFDPSLPAYSLMQPFSEDVLKAMRGEGWS